MSEKNIHITSTQIGYAHTRFEGVYTGPVTVADIKKKIYHPYFGGRDAWCKDGYWGAVRHDD